MCDSLEELLVRQNTVQLFFEADLWSICNEHPKSERDTVIRGERLLSQLAPLRAFEIGRASCRERVLQGV